MVTRYHKTIFSACLRFLFALLIVNALIFSPNDAIRSQASDVTLVIDTTIDSNDPAYQGCSDSVGDCNLRGAISVANADLANRYTINIPAGTYPISLPGASEDDNETGDFDIKGKVTLIGIEAGVSILGNQVDRVLHVHSAADVSIVNVNISGGRSPDGANGGDTEPGGGIYNQGSLTLQNSVIEFNQAGNGAPGLTGGIAGGDGGSGGGIQNEGHLIVEDSFLRGNEAGTGGAGYVCDSNEGDWFCWDCSHGGRGGVGGGINNAGALDIYNSSLEDNAAGATGKPGLCFSWGSDYRLPGQPGFGGGIGNLSDMTVVGSVLEGNRGELNGGGLSNQGYAHLFNVSISGNNASTGGGICNQRYLEIEDGLVVSNTADEGGGIFNDGELHILNFTLNGNNAVQGGGIYNAGDAFLAAGLVQTNWTRNGPDGEDETECVKLPCPPTDGGSPYGGGIYNAGKMQLDQGTVSGNATGDGGRGGDAYSGMNESGGGGNGGFGGGIYNIGSFDLNFTSVVSNTTGNGGSGGTGPAGDGQPGEGGFGGGIYNSGLMMAMFSQVLHNHTGTSANEGAPGGGIANEGRLAYSYGIIADNQTSPVGDGGGVYTSSPLTITSSTVINNTAGGRGGGAFAGGGSIYGINDIFARNEAGSDYQGSGLYIHATATKLLHTSLAQNTGGDGSGIEVIEASIWMTNTILVSHTIGISVALGAEGILDNTLWGNGIWANERDWAGSGSIITGTHNNWLEPGFVDPSNLDYHISPDSAALDRGTQTAIGTDLDNQPRPNPATGIVDLGADEYWEFTSVSEVEITGPMTGTTYTTIIFTATIIPEAATPNILYYWMPPPDNGQWTNTVSYLWKRPGPKTIQVSAINAGSVMTETFTISLETAVEWLFLPVVFR